ncbi:hypothetical protein LA76x_0420 [Lysobacter antibioticus]|uniref:Uncharacterized protein n=1 Tax=Lysobacter antibioticus TaxID=84531 RepID=A0A0S2F4V0_LYSAN|nr:hypothetical protein LA76x_0420 [Lysobacter antibioticus]
MASKQKEAFMSSPHRRGDAKDTKCRTCRTAGFATRWSI